MRKIIVIAQRELSAYFRSPVAYIVLIITLSVFNVLFFMIVDQNQEATLRDIFKVMEFMFIFIVPLLTMKIFAEERSSGTMEFLMTTPTSNAAIVLGKYLGSFLFFSLLILITTSYYFIIEYFSHPDRPATLTGFIGTWLEGALFLAVGMLTSSWSRSQIVAAISSYVILFTLYFSISFTKYFSGIAENMVRYISTTVHAENFYAGVITTGDVVYYLSGIVFCILLTRLSIETRLWR